MTTNNEVAGKFGIKIKVDFNIKKHPLNLDIYDGFVIPGGFRDAGYEEVYSEDIYKIAKSIYNRGGIIATMCVGALPIADAGLLRNKKATTYRLNRFYDNISRLQKGGAIYTTNKLEMDSNIISCAGPASSLEVAYLLIEQLTSKSNVDKVKKLMIY